MTLPDQRRYDRKHMNNHAQQFAFLQCVHNFPEGTLFVDCKRKLLLTSRGATKFKFKFSYFFRICLSDLPVNNHQII